MYFFSLSGGLVININYYAPVEEDPREVKHDELETISGIEEQPPTPKKRLHFSDMDLSSSVKKQKGHSSDVTINLASPTPLPKKKGVKTTVRQQQQTKKKNPTEEEVLKTPLNLPEMSTPRLDQPPPVKRMNMKARLERRVKIFDSDDDDEIVEAVKNIESSQAFSPQTQQLI